MGNSDEEMTEYSANEVYISQIQKLMQTLTDGLFKKDLSSITIQLIFYTEMLYGNDIDKKQ